ncbi:MAG: molybdopterin-dependent oxidoreductase [Acidobacteria bacterium]|nr:molybdopterin-dependent oxidoreductase [Acidobacteriota bacterium]MYE42798.1 molybdopterin-dependent oxidoreductase [Acidobacteriota bacterium]
MNRRRVLGALAASAAAYPFRVSGSQGGALPWSDLEPLPAGTRARYTDLTRITGEVVPNGEFFVLHHGEVPDLGAPPFRLAIGPRGAPPVRTLGLDELAGLPRRESVAAFECCGNGGVGMHGLVGAARWGGVPLAPVIEDLVGPRAREVVFFGADHAEERLRGNRYPSRFARSLPVADALAPEVLLADTMNGEPLPREHGGPLRLIVPGFYGVSQVKWVERIEVWTSRFAGWFQAKDYVTVRGTETPSGILHTASAIGPMRLKSIVTRIEGAAGGDLSIHGLAWNDGASEIAEVGVSLDGNPFEPAELLPAGHRFGFRRFRLDWRSPAPGEHRLVSRARDAGGVQPTEDEASRYKATPWENNGQVVRRIRI